MRTIGFNKQRDNESFSGLFPGSCQCFSTTDWMHMSFYTPKIKAEDDAGLALLVDDVCNKVGNPGIAERCAKKYGLSLKDNLAYDWFVQGEAMEEWLAKMGVEAEVEILIDLNTGRGLCSWDKLEELLKKGPVTIGTKNLGGLQGGHIILAVEGNKFHDPYGDARTFYKKQDGAYVEYTREFLEPHVLYDGGLRAMHVKLK